MAIGPDGARNVVGAHNKTRGQSKCPRYCRVGGSDVDFDMEDCFTD